MNKRNAPSGGFRPNPKRQLLFAVIAIAALASGYGIAMFFSEPTVPVEPEKVSQSEAPPKAWYKDQPTPPRLVDAPDMPLLPEPDAHATPGDEPTSEPAAAPLAYEESLPQNVYVAPKAPEPVPETAIASVAPTPEATSAMTSMPVETGEGPPTWLRYAIAAPLHAGSGPMIAIVIDDMGVDRRRTSRILDLPPPLTAAFLTYAKKLGYQAGLAKAAGHELLVHVAMEPTSAKVDPGPHVLLTGQDEAEMRRRLELGIDQVPGAIGINNHMGSRFTEDSRGMAVVMDVLKRRGMLFLDSRTSPKTVGPSVARGRDVPVVERNVFLDNKNDPVEVLKRLAETERLARKRGYAIAIGHPRDGTITALAQWLPQAEARGVRLVPLSAIAKRLQGLDVPVAGNTTVRSGG